MTDMAQSIKPAKKKKFIFIKILAVIVIATVILGLTASIQNDANTTQVSSDWTKYEFQIKNKKITLPCSYDELRSVSGYSMQKETANTYMSSDTTYKGANLFSLSDIPSLHIMLDPTKSESQTFDSCAISYINQSYQMIRDGADPVIFPGNLTAGDKTTVGKLIKAFGYPNELKYYPDESFVLTWMEDVYKKDSDYYKIVLEKECIEEIIIKNSK